MNTPISSLLFPKITEVEHIAALGDPILRNLQITQCYHELSAALVQLLGASANWCTFATWASKQAGQTIRKEDLKRALQQSQAFISDTDTQQASEQLASAARQMGTRLDAQAILAAMWEIGSPFAAIDRASDAVARGNLKVFAEIGYEFSRFLTVCGQDETLDAQKLADFCAALRPGDPPNGQRYLQQAFTHYYQAVFEPDAKQHAELMFLANLEIGYHEQTRLQPEIKEALEAAFVDPQVVIETLVQALFPWYTWLIRLFLFVMHRLHRQTAFERAVYTLLETVQKQVRQVLTEFMMTLTLAHGKVLHLGHDLNMPFPDALQNIENTELEVLLTQVDPTPDNVSETGAVDWADLPDRLHFIVDLFRCYHEERDLFDPPFFAEQVGDLKQGRLPQGEL